jgi:hypothetical protein
VHLVDDLDLGYQGEHNGGSAVPRSLLPGVAMVQTTQAPTENRGRHHCRPFLDRASVREFAAELLEASA